MTDSSADSPHADDEALRAKRMRAYTELGLGLMLRPRPAPLGTSLDPDPQGAPAVPAEPALRPAARQSAVATGLPTTPPSRQPATSPATAPATSPAPAPAAPQVALPAPAVHRPRSADSVAELEQLAAEVAACQACGLCKTRRQTVFAAGNPMAELAIVGEAPGAEEDRTGLAFVGNAGKLLDSMLASLGLNRQEHAYICNVIKCRPPDNRDPAPEEVARCEPFLQRQLGMVRPRAILVLGRFAAQTLLRTDASIASLRGRVHAYEVEGRPVPVVVTYHPAYLLRNLGDKAKAWADLCLLETERLRIGTER